MVERAKALPDARLRERNSIQLLMAVFGLSKKVRYRLRLIQWHCPWACDKYLDKTHTYAQCSGRLRWHYMLEWKSHRALRSVVRSETFRPLNCIVNCSPERPYSNFRSFNCLKWASLSDDPLFILRIDLPFPEMDGGFMLRGSGNLLLQSLQRMIQNAFCFRCIMGWLLCTRTSLV